MSFVKSESGSHSYIIWAASVLSTLCGVSLAYWMHKEPYSSSIYYLGLAHAIVFVPTMILTKQWAVKILVSGIVCVLFPFWGYTFLGFLSGGIGAPIANSVVWGIFVAAVCKRPLAIIVFLIIGIISNAALLLFLSQDKTADSYAWIPDTIAFWYVLTLPAFPILYMYRWEQSQRIEPCSACRYSLNGLANCNYCPECGTTINQSVK